MPAVPAQPNPARPAVADEVTFSALLAQAPFRLLTLGLDGRVKTASRSAVEACGYQSDQVIGRLFWECPWWSDSTPLQPPIEAAFHQARQGTPTTGEWPCRAADGREQWVGFELSALRNESGTVTHVIALGTDHDRQRRIETQYRTVRQRLDSALVAADIGTYQWDVQSDLLYPDQNLARLFGVRLAEDGAAPLDTFMAAIHEDDRRRVAARVRHSVETGENFAEDYRVTDAGGELRWVNSRGRVTRDAQGRVDSFFGLVMDITDRKKAEHEREAIADRLRRLTAIHETVLSGIKDFAYVFDLEGRFLYANRPLLELYGRPIDQVVGRTFSQLGYPPWIAEKHLREIATVIATRKPVQSEVAFRGESGNSGLFEYIFAPVFAADGAVEAVVGSTRDVTERRRAEVRDRLLVGLDDATRPLTDPQAITQAAARLLGEHLGVSRCAYADVEEDQNTFNLTGDYNRDVPSIVGRYRFDQFGDECLRLMRAGQPYVVEDSETDPRTADVRESYRATLIRSVICVPLVKDGRFVAAMAVHQNTVRAWRTSDIHAVLLVANRCWESIERTRVIRVLAESEQRLRLAIATARLGVWQLDLPARALTISAAARSLHGRDSGETFTYADFLASVHPEDRARLEAAIEESIATFGDFDLEYRTLWPDGSVHWALVRGQTSQGADLRPQRTIGVSLDITARKETEREQIRLRDEALRASRAKDEFLATLSHELRTPLNPILLIASDAVHDRTLAEETRESFDTIRRNVELEARLIDDLLDLTSIVRGKLTIRRELRDLHAILGDAIAAAQPTFIENGITLKLALGARQAGLMADGLRIAQILINLLKNAAKFTPRGGTVTVETLREPDGTLVVHIVDSGIGLTAAELERVFDAFEQGEHAREHSTHRFGGLGLGLAIAQRLAQLHGGNITAASAGRDQGACFTLRLPGSSLADSDAAGSAVGAHPAAPEAARAAGARILLVEDHEGTRHTLQRLLEKRNYRVMAAGSIAEARACAAQARFDIVVSDLGLPDGDGTVLMAELRSQHGLPGIALTGFGMDADIARCREAGFVAHLTKPIGVDALDDALRRVAP